MLAKMTSKNQLTLPRSVTDQVGATEYFDVAVHDGQIVLTPVRIQRRELGLTDADVRNAVDWARQGAEPAALMAAEPPPAYRVKRARSAGSAPTKTGRKA